MLNTNLPAFEFGEVQTPSRVLSVSWDESSVPIADKNWGKIVSGRRKTKNLQFFSVKRIGKKLIWVKQSIERNQKQNVSFHFLGRFLLKKTPNDKFKKNSKRKVI